jgi:SAM-dependent methyltransferase
MWKRLSAITKSKQPINRAEFWRDRAEKYGRRSVLNMAHREGEFDEVTDRQRNILFPLLSSQLNGREKSALDFGCGPGRFTGGLAQLIEGEAIGVDITPALLALAPESPATSYQCIPPGRLPFANDSFDVVWSCLVLGGISDDELPGTIAEIERVLKPGGLFFFAENTSDTPDAAHWTFRAPAAYVRLAGFCDPEILGSYQDVGETITIFAGRKR